MRRKNGCCGTYETEKDGAFADAKAPLQWILIEKIVPHKLLKKLIAVKLTDEAASVIVIGDIGRILGKNITDDLIDGVVALFGEGTVDLGENLLHFLVGIYGYSKLNGIMIQNARLLCLFSLSYTKFPIK